MFFLSYLIMTDPLENENCLKRFRFKIGITDRLKPWRKKNWIDHCNIAETRTNAFLFLNSILFSKWGCQTRTRRYGTINLTGLLGRSSCILCTSQEWKNCLSVCLNYEVIIMIIPIMLNFELVRCVENLFSRGGGRASMQSENKGLSKESPFGKKYLFTAQKFVHKNKRMHVYSCM